MRKENHQKYKLEIAENGRNVDMVQDFSTSLMRDPTDISMGERFTKQTATSWQKIPEKYKRRPKELREEKFCFQNSTHFQASNW
jgi:hypothetical protein